jgi:disulfide bond formation protein DsbB
MNTEVASLRAAPILSKDKKGYLFRQAILTLTGGLQFYDEENESMLPCSMIMVHVIRYIIFPVVALLIGLFLDSKLIAGIISGVVNAVLSAILQIYSINY